MGNPPAGRHLNRAAVDTASLYVGNGAWPRVHRDAAPVPHVCCGVVGFELHAERPEPSFAVEFAAGNGVLGACHGQAAAEADSDICSTDDCVDIGVYDVLAASCWLVTTTCMVLTLLSLGKLYSPVRVPLMVSCTSSCLCLPTQLPRLFVSPGKQLSMW